MLIGASCPLVAFTFGIMYMCCKNKCTAFIYILVALAACGGLGYVSNHAFNHKNVLDAQYTKLCNSEKVKSM